MSDRIQVGWSHPNNTKYPDLEYVLEYGCGIKFMGQEQFRKIYQGKAHKCIVADLNANATYRFRVKAQQKAEEGATAQVEGDWSETVGVSTLPLPKEVLTISNLK